MIRHSCRLTFSCLMLPLLLDGSVAPRPQAPSGDFGKLTLRVTVPDRRFLVFEPIPLTLRLENQTSGPVTGHTLLEFAAGLTTLLVQPEGSAAYEVKSLSLGAAIMEPGSTIVQPRETHEVEELLTLGLDKAFPKPGRYSIQFVLHSRDWKAEVRSNVIVLELRVPDGVEQSAQHYMESTGAAGSFFTGLLDDDVDRRLTEVATNYASTPYGDYANLFLGGRSVGLRDYERARMYLSRAAAQADFPLRQRAAVLLAELAELEGK